MGFGDKSDWKLFFLYGLKKVIINSLDGTSGEGDFKRFHIYDHFYKL